MINLSYILYYMGFKDKYLKYKSKYLQLKDNYKKYLQIAKYLQVGGYFDVIAKELLFEINKLTDHGEAF